MISRNAAEDVCRRLEHDIAPMEKAFRLAHWDAETTGDAAAFQQMEECQKSMMRRLADREDYALVDRLRSDQALDAGTRRQLERWRNRMAPNQIDDATIERLARQESELLQQYNAFRAKLDGRTVGDNEIDRILADSTSPVEVEEAWRASKRIAEDRGEDATGPTVVERLLDLVRLRNQAAAQIGYSSAYVAALELGELDPQWLWSALADLDRATRPIFRRWKADLDAKLAKRFHVAPADLRPWHYGDRFFQTPPRVEDDWNVDPIFQNKDIVELTNRSFDAMGFDVRPIAARSDLYPGDPATSRKCQHAFCTSIDAPRDVRVLCNITPGQRWMSTNLHEFGHAVYGAELDPGLPFILRDDAHLLANEAIALLMERHMVDPWWLAAVVGLPEDRAAQIADRGRRQLATKHLVFTRWVLVMCHFERALYDNPDSPDLASLWWDVVEEFQEVRRPEPGRSAHDWASKIHFVGYPAYYQNYLLGEIFGTQLERAVRRDCGGLFGRREAGERLAKGMFRRGATLPWRDLLREVAGEDFSIQPFLEVVEQA